MDDRWNPRRAPGPHTWPVQVDPTGRCGPTRGQANGPRWRTSSRGWFVPSAIDPDQPAQRIVEAVPLLPSGGGLTGWAALHLAEVAFLDGRLPGGRRLPVQLEVGPGASRRPRPGIAFLEHRLEPVVRRYGAPCMPARRSLFDAMRLSDDLREAVVAMDMTAAAKVMSISRMRNYVARHPGWNGVPVVRTALDLADEASLSPPETRLRLLWMLDARLPRPLVNQPVFDLRGRLLGIPDLLDVESGTAVDYDGEEHRKMRRHTSDVGRDDRFREHRLEGTRVTALDMLDRGKVVDRLLAARRRAAFEAPSRRTWTVVPPPWYRVDVPLDLHLDMRGEPD